MPRYPRTLNPAEMITRTVLGHELEFRRAHGTEFLVTSCGRFVINAYYDHKITYLTQPETEKKWHYLRIDGNSVHVLVAKAWVFNPNPDLFKVCDHIDRDVFNNSATNLRWITQQLNTLNRDRTYARKIKHKRKSGKWSIYWRSCVTVDDVEINQNFSSRAAAEENTLQVINEAFNRIHEEGAQRANPTRADHLFYWRDDTPARAIVADPGTGGTGEGGTELSSVSSEC